MITDKDLLKQVYWTKRPNTLYTLVSINKDGSVCLDDGLRYFSKVAKIEDITLAIEKYGITASSKEDWAVKAQQLVEKLQKEIDKINKNNKAATVDFKEIEEIIDQIYNKYCVECWFHSIEIQNDKIVIYIASAEEKSNFPEKINGVDIVVEVIRSTTHD